MSISCKLRESMGDSLFLALSSQSLSRGKSLCESCSYTTDECPSSNKINVGYMGYSIVDRECKMPKQEAYCKECNLNTAKPIAYIQYRSGRGIVVECMKCHSRYAMAESTYISRYIGRHTKYGYIPPNYGKKTELSRNVKEPMSKQKDAEMQKLLGYSDTEYKDFLKRMDESNKKSHKKAKIQHAEYDRRVIEERIQAESDKRKKLIEKGILVYNKKERCLVDTRTGELVKL